MHKNSFNNTDSLSSYGKSMIDLLTKKTPKIHCITNYVTATLCANAALAIGASPIMADAPEEVDEITSGCDAIMLNTGTPNQSRFIAMLMAAETASKLRHPIVIDPVACSASKYRSAMIKQLLETAPPTVIKGNLSEIYAIANKAYNYTGVDTDQSLKEVELKFHISIAKKLALELKSIVIITGETDIVTDGTSLYLIKNGISTLTTTTGTGCMLSAIIAAFCAITPNQALEASAFAVALMGLSGELADERIKNKDLGLGSFPVFLMDYLSKTPTAFYEKGLKYDYIK